MVSLQGIITMAKKLIAIDRTGEQERGLIRKKDPKDLSEWAHQKRISHWLKANHPEVRFIVSLAGLVHTGSYLGQMIKALQWFEAGYPDLIVHESVGGFSFLAIELKKYGARLKGDHIERQQAWLNYLKKQGARVAFCIGSDEAIKVIDNYLHGKQT